jgi:hypothetical protein
MADYMNGRRGWKETAKDMATKTYQAPVNKVVQGSMPFTKLAAELITRRSTFPDTFKPGTIRDRGLHMARAMGMENEYIALAGKPSRGYGRSIKDLFLYRIDPGEVAYRNAFDLKNSFMKKAGKISEGFWLTPSGDALYNIKLAMKYGDKDMAKKYFNEYWNLPQNKGKTPAEIMEGVTRSFETMHPLHGMSAAMSTAFVSSLNSEDKKTIGKAINFYNDVISGKKIKAKETQK